MATSTAGLCAAVRRALGDDRLVQHWSVETDSGASAFVLFRAEADALHVSALVKNDGYVRASLDDAALATMQDNLPFEYDDDDGANGFAADLAAAPTGGKRGGFQPSRFVVKEKKKPRR